MIGISRKDSLTIILRTHSLAIDLTWIRMVRKLARVLAAVNSPVYNRTNRDSFPDPINHYKHYNFTSF